VYIGRGLFLARAQALIEAYLVLIVAIKVL